MFRSLRASIAIPAAAVLAASAGASAGTWYVRAVATNGNGLAWATPFNNLQSAINAAVPGDSIYIAAGTYRPSVRRESNTERSRTFALKGNVKYLGGFPAAGGTLAERDPG